jgi:anthranilate synthase component I
MSRAEAAPRIFMEELEGDILTPISIYQRISGEKKFLLESSLKHERSGRYSFIGADPVFELKGIAGKSLLVKGGEETELAEPPLEMVKKLLPDKDLKAPFPLAGGAVGYVGYDSIRQYEDIGKVPNDQLGIPDVHLMFFEVMAVYDHAEQKVSLIGTRLADETTDESLKLRIARLRREIEEGQSTQADGRIKISKYSASETKESFVEKVKKAKEHIIQGDIFQVVLSQRMQADIEGDPFSFYRRLRIQNPSPYMYFLNFGDYAVAGASPESLIKADAEKITTNPIAGTRPRGRNEKEDERLAADLLTDEKELAEHRMLLDLGRNDLGRVCEFGSVKIEKYMQAEKFRHVIHLVSEVSGKLKPEYSPADSLAACLPAGTVSGAPKIRAMEIINELEEYKRGVYSGAIGYFSANGNMDFALAIRTMLIKGDKAYIQAGAGIVHDSVPEKEYEETIHKLRAFLEDQNDFIN